jgi:hypothetical protein
MLGGTVPCEPCASQFRMVVSIWSSRVAARRWHAAEEPGGSATFAEEEKRHDVARAIEAAAAASTPLLSLSWDFQPLRFDQYGAPEESTLDFLVLSELPCGYRSPGTALRRHFRAISYSI